MSLHVILFLICALFSSNVVKPDFTQHFRQFLDTRFGDGSAARFVRADMGAQIGGSFGGRRHDNDPVRNHPVVFTHGLTLRASAFLTHRAYFIGQGYSESELYATTYSDGGLTPFFYKTMNCEDVKQIREFIKAVYIYTNMTVDVLAYSMGVAISRKAIMGGRCVDTDEYLGGSITRLVHRYVAVAGVAYGYENCPRQFKACNKVNGMVCESNYIRDVNSKTSSYEGASTYAIYSIDDHLVGQNCCGHTCSALKNANGTIVQAGYDHVAIFLYTKDKQFGLIRNGTAYIKSINANNDYADNNNGDNNSHGDDNVNEANEAKPKPDMWHRAGPLGPY